MKVGNANMAAIRAWKGNRQVFLAPVIHSKSRLWESFHDSPVLPRKDPIMRELDLSWAGGNNPHEMMRTFVGLKNIRNGAFVEAGIFRDCAIPPIKGSTVHIVSYDESEVGRTHENYPYTVPVRARLESLPSGPLRSGSFDIAVWHGGMLPTLKVCGLDHPSTPIEKCASALKAIRGLWSIIKPGGYFIEFYPFDDWKELPKALLHMKLEVSGVEFLKRRTDRIDPYEVRHVHLMISDELGLTTESQATDLMRLMVRNREKYLLPYLNPVPYSVMIIRK